MAPASRASLVFVGLVLASFWVSAAHGGRVLVSETSKLDVGGVGSALEDLLSNLGGVVNLKLKVKVAGSEEVPEGLSVALSILDAVGGPKLVKLNVGVSNVVSVKVRLFKRKVLRLKVEVGEVSELVESLLADLLPVVTGEVTALLDVVLDLVGGEVVPLVKDVLGNVLSGVPGN